MPLSRFIRSLAALVVAASFMAPVAAQAWWRGGVWIGVPPVVVAPPAYYYPPPPAYYPPPYPGYYAPPAYTPAPPPDQQGQYEGAPAPQGNEQAQAQSNAPYGAMCYAGVYNCAAPPNTRVGSVCSCPGLGAPSFGTVN